MKFYLINLGCSKNLVDSELMSGLLVKAGYIMVEKPAYADTIVVNTCSFIEQAVNESIDTILELAELKKEGICKRLIVVGCLVQRFGEQIADELPEVDMFIGTGGFHSIVQAVDGLLDSGSCYLPKPDFACLQKADDPRILSNKYSAYIKIAQGCSKHCTYCIIPKLRGKQRSRPVNDIITEARSMVLSGVKEITLVAQDTSFYGTDLKPVQDLNTLLNSLSQIQDNIWIRFLYTHPNSINENIIETVAKHSNICSYFDIPIQHVSRNILKNMGRNYSENELFNLYDKIKIKVPDASLRTTVMVGFPGETDNDFSNLLNFVKEIRFDHVGTFIYSDSEDLPCHRLSDHVPESLAKKRYDRLMLCQQNISLEKNQKHLNKVYKVLVEEYIEKNIFIGRTYFQGPEVDGITYIHGSNVNIGSFANVKITDALEYDLIGEVI